MSGIPPTRCEILEKYRDVIESDDFEVLQMDELPHPSVMQKENVGLVWLGKIREFLVFLKKHPVKALGVVVVTTGSIESSLQFAERVDGYALEVANVISSVSTEQAHDRADTYLVVTNQKRAPDGPTGPTHREYFLLTSTPTSTSTTTTQLFDVPLPTGSGVIPTSKTLFRLS
jgi:hypothetical protein